MANPKAGLAGRPNIRRRTPVIRPYSQLTMSAGPGLNVPVASPSATPRANTAGNIRPFSEMQVSIGGGKTIPVSQWQAWVAQGRKPGVPPGTAPAATPPAPTAGAMPPDAQLEADIFGLGRQRDVSLGNIGAGRVQGLAEYGYNEGAIDPTTGYGALSFDPNNPFSKASLLKRNYDTQRRTAAQSMGSTGGLYSGAFQTAQDVTNRNQLQDTDVLQKSLAAFLAQNTGQRAQAQVDYETGVGRAQGEAVGRFGTNPLYGPTAGEGDTATAQQAIAGKATAGPIVTNKLGHKGRWMTRADGSKYFARV